jgi:hypothetical protein
MKSFILSKVIAHELGHAIGMQHVDTLSIMRQGAPLDPNGMIIPYNAVYADSSKNQLTIRKPWK